MRFSVTLKLSVAITDAADEATEDDASEESGPASESSDEDDGIEPAPLRFRGSLPSTSQKVHGSHLKSGCQRHRKGI